MDAYGVAPGDCERTYNLKVNSSRRGQLWHINDITLIYDKLARTVQFKSHMFDLYQDNLPEDVDFCVMCAFDSKAEVELEILTIE